MSEILDRMIRRARAPLAPVEPLYPPRFGPSAPPSGILSNVPSEYEESSLETAAPVATSSSSLQAKDDRPAIEAGISQSLMGSSTVPLAVTPAVEHHGLQPLPANAPVLRRQVLPHSTDSVSLGSVHNAAEPYTASPAERTTHPAPSSEATLNTSLLPQAMTSRRRQTAPLIPTHSDRRPENSALPPPGPDPVVTISIGHIELHAPRPAERPRKPAFRPKVSLSDFLKRSVGSAHE